MWYYPYYPLRKERVLARKRTTKKYEFSMPPKLTCREARLLLRVAPLETTYDNLAHEFQVAIRHYLSCDVCKKLGIIALLGAYRTHCINVCGYYLYYCDPLWGRLRQEEGGSEISVNSEISIMYLIAVESVFGNEIWHHQPNSQKYNSPVCKCSSCKSLRSFWEWHDNERNGFSVDGGIELFERILRIFIHEDWPLDDLFNWQMTIVGYIEEAINPDSSWSEQEKRMKVEILGQQLKTLQRFARALYESRRRRDMLDKLEGKEEGVDYDQLRWDLFF